MVIHFLQLNLTGHPHGLSVEEIKDLWVQADIDGNGILDYSEFQVSFSSSSVFYFKIYQLLNFNALCLACSSEFLAIGVEYFVL